MRPEKRRLQTTVTPTGHFTTRTHRLTVPPGRVLSLPVTTEMTRLKLKADRGPGQRSEAHCAPRSQRTRPSTQESPQGPPTPRRRPPDHSAVAAAGPRAPGQPQAHLRRGLEGRAQSQLRAGGGPWLIAWSRSDSGLRKAPGQPTRPGTDGDAQLCRLDRHTGPSPWRTTAPTSKPALSRRVLPVTDARGRARPQPSAPGT